MSDDDQVNDQPFGTFSMHGLHQPNNNPTTQADATIFAKLLLGSYRHAEIDDPEVFAATLVRTLCSFPFQVVIQVCDPAIGLPSKMKWFPSLAEIRSECNAVAAELAYQERLSNWGKSLPPPEDRSNRPTMDELKAKWGPNWGITQSEPPSSAKGTKPGFKSMTKEELAEHYKKFGLGFSIKSVTEQTDVDASRAQHSSAKV